jgi:hypothetical protein
MAKALDIEARFHKTVAFLYPERPLETPAP